MRQPRSAPPAPRAGHGTGGATLSVQVVRGILAGAAAHGLEAGALAREAGIDPGALHDADARVPAVKVAALWELAPARTGDARFGLHLAARAAQTPHPVLGQLFAASANLGEGLRRAMRYQSLMLTAARSSLEVITPQGIARLRHAPAPGSGVAALPGQAVEFGFAALLALARVATGVALPARAVRFAHAGAADAREHEAFFGAPVAFGAGVNELDLPAEALALPHVGADPALASLIEGHARRRVAVGAAGDDFLDRARRALAAGLARGDGSLATAAKALGVEPRTLQRRLRGAGTSHQRLLDELRERLSREYLSDRRFALAEVAFLLGFADQAAFHRAFVRWTGATPGRFRRDLLRARTG